MAPADEAKKSLAKAEQALKPSWVSFKFSPDFLSASLEYSQAATQFRAAGLLQESADAWTKTGEMKEKLNDLFGAGRAYESAAAICDGTGPGGANAAIVQWEKAIRCFRLAGKSDQAAKLILKMASLREKEGDIEGGKSAYREAIEIFEQEEKDFDLGDVYKSYIGFLIRANSLEDAMKAIDGHIEVLVRQKSLPFAHKELLSKIVLLIKLEDGVRADESLNASGSISGWFTSKECQVASDLVEAFKTNDAEAMAGLIKDQTFSFLQVEVARIAKQLKVVMAAPARSGGYGGNQEPQDLAEMLM